MVLGSRMAGNAHSRNKTFEHIRKRVKLIVEVENQVEYEPCVDSGPRSSRVTVRVVGTSARLFVVQDDGEELVPAANSEVSAPTECAVIPSMDNANCSNENETNQSHGSTSETTGEDCCVREAGGISLSGPDVQHSRDEEPVREKRRGRGCTRNIKLRRMGPGDKQIILEFDEDGRVCSKNATEFANHCGLVVRENALQQVSGWYDIPQKIRENIFQLCCVYYEVPNNPKIKYQIMQSLAKKFRDFRARLKKQYFDKHETNEERLQNCPSQVNPEDWAYLVHLSFRPKARETGQARVSRERITQRALRAFAN